MGAMEESADRLHAKREREKTHAGEAEYPDTRGVARSRSNEENEAKEEGVTETTEIGMRVARALAKRNLTRPKASLESVAEVVDEIAMLPLVRDALASMTGLGLIERASSEAAKRAGTF